MRSGLLSWPVPVPWARRRDPGGDGVRAADLVTEESPPDDGPSGPGVFCRQGGGRAPDAQSLSPPAEHSDIVHALRLGPPADRLA